jgi:hypothetical protein
MKGLPKKFSHLGLGVIWTPEHVCMALLLLVLRSGTSRSDAMLRQLSTHRPDILPHEPGRSGFAKARAKITADMLATSWEHYLQAFFELFGDVLPTIHGHRLLAIDGVTVNGCRAKTLFKALRPRRRGRPPLDPKGQPQLLIVALVDVLTRQPLTWVAVEPGRGERSAFNQIKGFLGPKTILVADRGFPSRELLTLLLTTQCRFVLRTTTGTSAFGEVQDALRGGHKDRNVRFRLEKRKNSVFWNGRLVRGRPKEQKGKTAEEWCLITNLPRNHRWTRFTILDLYHQRWGIETFFREWKKYWGGDCFHSHSLEGMKQEVTMSMLAASMVAAMELTALVVCQGRMPRWNDPIQKRCVRPVLTMTLELLLVMDPRHQDVSQWLDKVLHLSGLHAQKRRPNRRFPRICKSFYGKWKHTFKRRA